MILILVAGTLAVSLTVVVMILGTMTVRARKCPSYPPGTPTKNGVGFPTNYPAARQVFLEAVADAGGRLESIRNPEHGPAGEDLFMDVALFGDEAANRTLVICSGTHGVEGFAGSGIQSRLLRHRIVSDLPPTVNVLMIHAINPYGMAYLRRFNEDNVDVNRNFGDHSVPVNDPNTGYGKLSDVIAPTSMSFRSEGRSWRKLLAYRVTHGNAELKRVITQGQYAYPDGLFFGGNSEVWSNRTLRSIIVRYLADRSRVMVIDLHTGLGEYGKGEILLHEGEETPGFRRAVQVWGKVKTSVTGDSVSSRIETSVKRAFSDELGEGTETIAVTLEFGTLPPMEAFIALRAENWLHHHGGLSHPREREIEACLLQAFHPGMREWEEAIWIRGKDVIEQALTHLAQ